MDGLLTFHWWYLLVLLALVTILRAILLEDRKQVFDDNFGRAELRRWNKGLYLGNGRITRRRSFQHCAVIAGSGMGKTVSIILPTLLSLRDRNTSIICLDVSRELHAKSAGFQSRFGKVLVLDLTDHRNSIGYNPLVLACSPTELGLLAEILLAPQTKNTKDSFWSIMAKKVLVFLFKLIVKLPTQFQNLANARHLSIVLLGNPEAIDRLVVRLTRDDEQLWEEYKGLIGLDSRLLTNIVASAQAALEIFSDPEIARVTASHTFSCNMLRKERISLYLWADVTSISYYRPIFEMLFSQFFSVMMKRLPTRADNDVFLIADELGSFAIPGFMEASSNIRKFNVSLCWTAQSRSQISTQYSQEGEKTIMSNMFHQMYFGGMEPQVADMLSKRLGRWSFEKEGGGIGSREVATSSELQHLLEGQALLISGATPPAKIRLVPYYQDWTLSRRSTIATPPVEGQVKGEVELLDIDAFLESEGV